MRYIAPSRSPLGGEGVGVASCEDMSLCIIGESGGGEGGVRFRLMILLGLLRLLSSSSEHGSTGISFSMMTEST